MATGDWALLVSVLSILVAAGSGVYAGISAISTKHYAEDTRKLVDAAMYPVLDVEFDCIATGDILKATNNPGTYINVRFKNTHASVDALDLTFEIELGVIMDKHIEGGYIKRTKLTYKMYHKESIGTLAARKEWRQDLQFGDNTYETSSSGTHPSGHGLETFIREYLPEYREQEVTGKLVDGWLGMRLNYSFRPASYGASVFHETEYYTVYVSLNQQNVLNSCLIRSRGKA
jgi:hypothetical protein